jgi:hypothetical protein
MAELFESPLANLVLLAALTATLVAGAIYVIGRVRSGMRGKDPPASRWLTNFQQLHDRGELTDEEYRTIKAMLAEDIQRELNSTDERR